MRLSKFGKKFTGQSGILQLMDDLGNALAGDEETLMLGGGNPSHIPQMHTYFRQTMGHILEDDAEFSRMIGNYAPPQGDKRFIKALVALLNDEFGWDIGPQNIALTNGSQSAFFILFNLFAGEFTDGTHKRILFPLAPEYIGYADAGLEDDFFVANRPEIEYIDEHTFKYHIDFDSLKVTDDIGAMCVSRPTNPTGNVLTDEEIEKLVCLAQKNDIPLIIDNAYGTPFPNIIFTEAKPVFNEQTIVCMSLSKLGLPAARIGIIVADEAVVKAVSSINAIQSLTPGSMGAVLVSEMVRNGDIIALSRNIIKPYYQQKANRAVEQLCQMLKGYDFYIHKPEGAIFLWLWFKGLPINSQELYERLKARNVLVVPGHYFFPGLEGEWRHTQECIRVTYAQDREVVEAGLQIIAEEVKRAYAEG